VTGRGYLIDLRSRPSSQAAAAPEKVPVGGRDVPRRGGPPYPLPGGCHR